MRASPDVVVIGAGLIGLALARELVRRGAAVEVYDRGCAGRESSWAGAGMLAAQQTPAASPLRELALASARMYPDFIAALRNETGAVIDYRTCGTRMVGAGCAAAQAYPDDHCVDNRELMAALIAAARPLGIRLRERCAVLAVRRDGDTLAVSTAAGVVNSAQVVNAAGAWAAQIDAAPKLPTRPRKGQILALRPRRDFPIATVLVGGDVYLVPRGDGRVIVGATVEDVGFDKTVDPETIARLHASAAQLCPDLADAEVVEAWAGLRPGTPDDLPLLGPTHTPGYWAATGHFRDGILLTPITAALLADAIEGRAPRLSLAPFDPARFKK